MSLESARFATWVAAAVGEDAQLASELRASVIDGARRHLDLMRRSRCDGNWRTSSRRLKGLASSFGLDRLAALAEDAIDGAPSDPRVLREIDSEISLLAA